MKGDPSLSTTSKGQWVMSYVVFCTINIEARELKRANLFDIGITSEIKKERIDDSVKGIRGLEFTHSNLRPISRLASKTVFRGFIAA